MHVLKFETTFQAWTMEAGALIARQIHVFCMPSCRQDSHCEILDCMHAGRM